MEYVTFDPQIHDAELIAAYRYDVDFRTFDKLFDSRKKAVSAIAKSLKKDECIKVIYDNGNIIGMLMIYTQEKKPKTSFKSLKLLIVDILDHFVICDIKKGDLYIAEIAIDESQRSKGYGTKVINDVIEYARKNGYRRVLLDADFRNPKAKALYESMGFKVFNKKSFLKRGMYNMELVISEN
ncbi:GNAT family N-acetyltransferase [Methanobrevibacter millerae]|uniref:Acetyltransferase (GNAT) family protein n=1 Tax=Methanobrevibacter millerae TaxID=230361 RepID=A0A1G5VIZ7_9EURY|nr:GNAT family N-acetyltransferase [Methanobrevibacter millerae]SDA45891.1 Acetyltransferase (GNAT) family protein [Methanobrevibacter millerae]